MTKKEIVKAISEEMGLTQLVTKEVVQKTFEAIIETLITDDKRRIELRNFGVFEVKRRAARMARNPRTGDSVEVGEKYVVTFKPGKEMEAKVRELEITDGLRKPEEGESYPSAAETPATPPPAAPSLDPPPSQPTPQQPPYPSNDGMMPPGPYGSSPSGEM